jgi:hypothetical protein
MPKLLRRFLRSADLRRHLAAALVVGGLLRLLSAVFVYGPQALDDYKHGVLPAYQLFAGLPVELPEYRSPLLVWLLGGFTHLGSWLGADSALAQVRAMYLGLGAVSLAAIGGTYLYVRRFRSRIFAALALYLVAAFPLIPFVSTRAFGEAVAMSLVTLAFGMLESTRLNGDRRLVAWLGGFLVLGLATLFRFHVGLIYLAYGAVLAGMRIRAGVAAGVIAGFATLAAEAIIDVAGGRAPLATLSAYLIENADGGAKYGVMPWYGPLLLVLGVSLFPFSALMWRSTGSLWRRLWPVLIPALVFVVAHSLTPHKEDRFLYPILGLELWALAYLWSSSARTKLVRRVYTPVFLAAAALLLPLATLVNSQEGEIEPPALLERRYRAVLFLENESSFGKSRFQRYFLRANSFIETVAADDLVADRVDRGLAERKAVAAVALLTGNPEAQGRLRALENTTTMAGACLRIRTSGSIVDRWLYALHARFNQRRRPTWYLVCERR